MLIRHPLDAILENPGGCAERAAFGFGAFGGRMQFVGYEPGLEHAVPRLADERGDVDAHRADQRAAAAHRAGVVDEFLPLTELFCCDFSLQAEQAIEERKRARLALVGLLEDLELPDRRVFRVSGLHVVMAGFGTLAAVHARFQIRGRRAVHVLCETGHGAAQALVTAHIALSVVTRVRVLCGQPLCLCLERIFFCDFAHTWAPLCVKATPVA